MVRLRLDDGDDDDDNDDEEGGMMRVTMTMMLRLVSSQAGPPLTCPLRKVQFLHCSFTWKSLRTV